MPTNLVLYYTFDRIIRIPTKIARLLQANENEPYGKPWTYYTKWATLYYIDGDGKEQEVRADGGPEECKRSDSEEFVEDGSDDEDEEDNKDKEDK